MDSSTDFVIYECPATMYMETTKKWVNGTFHLSSGGIFFECAPLQADSAGFYGISIDFEEMSLIAKEASSYVFPSLTILVGKTKYWFSSFSRRETVFTLLEHFHKQMLFTTKTNEGYSEAKTDDFSCLGHELLAVAHDSSKTLNSASRALHRQGKQLNDALLTAENINDDLIVAGNMISRLESWFGGYWPATTTKDKKPIVQVLSKQRFKEIPVVYHKDVLIQNPQCKPQMGLLRFGEGNLEVISDKGNVVNQFQRQDVSCIYVFSPWEIGIHQTKIGERDIKINITTAQLIVIMPLLQRYFSNRLNFHSPESAKPKRIRPSANCGVKGMHRIITTATPLPSHDSNSSAQATVEKIVTEDEAQELSQMISSMKLLAVEISREQNEQLDTINQITSSVDTADVCIKEDIRRMKRLM